MPEYPVRVPRGENDQVASSIEAFINARFESLAAKRMTFRYTIIAAALDLPLEAVRALLAPLDGGEDGLMVWSDTRRRRHSVR